MPFHSLSRGNKRWGKLATFITKYQLLMRQVESGAAFQVSLEEDVVLEPGFCAFVQSACAAYLARPQASIVQMSGFAEVQMTPYTSAQSQLTTDIPTKTQL